MPFRDSFFLGANPGIPDVLVQSQIGNQLLQPGVFVAQVLDLFGFAHFYAAVLRLPGIDRMLAYVLFPSQVFRRAIRFNLLQRSNDLRLRVTALAHPLFPFPSSKI
jgi:hypothetical protein